jgi:hypothetical protein
MNCKARHVMNVRSVVFTAAALLIAFVAARADDGTVISRW